MKISVKKLFGEEKVALKVTVKDYFDSERSAFKVIPVTIGKSSPKPPPIEPKEKKLPFLRIFAAAVFFFLLSLLVGLFPSFSDAHVTELNDQTISLKIAIAYVLGFLSAFAFKAALSSEKNN